MYRGLGENVYFPYFWSPLTPRQWQLLCLIETHDGLMTHLPFGSLGPRGHDRHKAPQHTEPAGTETEVSNRRQVE